MLINRKVSHLSRYLRGKIQPITGGIQRPEYTDVQRAQVLGYVERLKNIQIVIPELAEEFGDIPDLIPRVASREDFPDDSWRNEDSIELRVIDSDEEINKLGRELFSSLTSGVSQRHVAIIFILAYQLKRAGNGTNTNLLPKVDVLRRPRDWKLDLMDTKIDDIVGRIIVPTEGPDKSSVARAYAYLAASLLKLFTKSPENYERSWNHIITGFGKFYSGNCPVTCAPPNPAVIKKIHDHFSMSKIMKVALYRYLYNANDKGPPKSVQKYLYDIHLSHTGMRVLLIAYQICSTMNCSPAVLIRVVNANRFKPQISALIAAFKLMQATDEAHRRKMWKYGRIFDSGFFSALQTKACPKFVYILACILQRESPESHSGILEIKQLEEVNAEDQERLKEGASVLIKAIKSARKMS